MDEEPARDARAAAGATPRGPSRQPSDPLAGLLSPSGDLLVSLLDPAQPVEAQEACSAFAEECNRSACQFLAMGNPARSLKQLRRAHRVLGLDWAWTDAEMQQRLLALTLNNMACERQHRGEHADARRYLQEAVQIERRLEDGRPGSVPKPAETLCNLAVVTSKTGKHRAAIELIQSAIGLLEHLRDTGDARGGPESLHTVAAAQYNLGAEHEHLQNWNQALKAYRECLGTVRHLTAASKAAGAVAGARSHASLAMAERAMRAVMDLQRRVESEARLRRTMHLSRPSKPGSRRSRSTGPAQRRGWDSRSAAADEGDEMSLYSDSSLAIDRMPGGRNIAALARVSGDVRRLMSDGVSERISQSRVRVGRRRPATSLPRQIQDGRRSASGSRPRVAVPGAITDPMLDRLPGHKLTRAQEAWGAPCPPVRVSKPRLAPLARRPPSTAPAGAAASAWGFITVPAGLRGGSGNTAGGGSRDEATSEAPRIAVRRPETQPLVDRSRGASGTRSQHTLAGLSPATAPSPTTSLWSPGPIRSAESPMVWASDPRASPGARSVTWADDNAWHQGDSPALGGAPGFSSAPAGRGGHGKLLGPDPGPSSPLEWRGEAVQLAAAKSTQLPLAAILPSGRTGSNAVAGADRQPRGHQSGLAAPALAGSVGGFGIHQRSRASESGEAGQSGAAASTSPSKPDPFHTGARSTPAAR